MTHLARVVAEMRAGGYYDRILACGPELDRVKAYLRRCAGEEPNAPPAPLMYPTYPCFPGLRHRPWHDARALEAARILEDHFPTIRDEALRLGEDARLDYSRAVGPLRTWRKPWRFLRRDTAAPKSWTLYPLYHMGVEVEGVMGLCPRTRAIVASIPGACLDHAWGDFVFSAMGPGAHLKPHCSIDDLRLRIHLGISIPEGCSIRVANETRTWQEGRALAFEDSFEHEVWNRSGDRRIVLIADLWHPDLTAIEVRALTAAFRKSRVRRVFMRERMEVTDDPRRYLPAIEAALQAQDADPAVREFWPD